MGLFSLYIGWWSLRNPHRVPAAEAPTAASVSTPDARPSAPDAIQLSIGQAMILQSTAGKQKPSLVLRTDVANVYGKTLPSAIYSEIIGDAV